MVRIVGQLKKSLYLGVVQNINAPENDGLQGRFVFRPTSENSGDFLVAD